MKLYSDFGPRRTRQIIGDVLALAAVAAWVWLGITVYQLVENLAAFGVQMEEAGAGFKETMTEVGDTLGSVPLIGPGIRAPFDGASGAGGALESAGQSQQIAVNQLATGLGIGIAALPIDVAAARALLDLGEFRALRTRLCPPVIEDCGIEAIICPSKYSVFSLLC